MNAKRTRREIIFGILSIFVLFWLYRVFTVYTVRSGECRPRLIDPSQRLVTRDVDGVKVSFPERNGFPAQTKPLIVMTFNIAGHDELWHSDHIAQIAAVINQVKPDVVALQEVHRGTWQARFRDQLDELQAATHLHGVFGKSYAQGKGLFGNAILTRGEIVHADVHELPSVGEPRTLLETTVRIDGALIDVYCAHLTTWDRLNQRNRREQLECLAQHVRTSPRPYILMGDFNAAPDAPEVIAFREMHAARLSGPALGATQPTMGKRIDYIWTDYGWSIGTTRRLRTGPSDHWPVVTELWWNRG